MQFFKKICETLTGSTQFLNQGRHCNAVSEILSPKNTVSENPVVVEDEEILVVEDEEILVVEDEEILVVGDEEILIVEDEAFVVVDDETVLVAEDEATRFFFSFLFF